MKERQREEQSMNLAGWHTLIPRPIKGPDDAVALVTTLGFCTWGPVPRMAFPNLAEAMGETATSVLVRTWFWKDDLHFTRQLYYGKIIAGQPSFIAPGYLADFIAALAGWGLERERDPIRLLPGWPSIARGQSHLRVSGRAPCTANACIA
jgi:hypothetical protein